MSDDSGFSSLGLLWLVLWWTFLSIFVVSMDTPISAGTVPRSSRWVMDGHMLSLLRCCQTHVQSICSMLPFHQPYLSIPVALSANIRWHLLSWSVFISATLVCDCIDFTGISLLTKNTENFQKSLTMERSSFMRCLLKSSPTYLRCCCLLFSKCQLFVGGKNSENMFSNCVAFIDSSFPPPQYLIMKCSNKKKAWKLYSDHTYIYHLDPKINIKYTCFIISLFTYWSIKTFFMHFKISCRL